MKNKVITIGLLVLGNLILCAYAYISNNLGSINSFEILYHLTTNIKSAGSFTVIIDAIKSIWYIFIFISLT